MERLPEIPGNRNRRQPNGESRPRTIYIGPEAYGLFTMPYTSAQGMENTANNAPIKLRLIYTMIK